MFFGGGIPFGAGGMPFHPGMAGMGGMGGGGDDDDGGNVRERKRAGRARARVRCCGASHPPPSPPPRPLQVDNEKFYKILGIEKTATQTEVKKAYMRLAKEVRHFFCAERPGGE
jgi:hypothetical protein